MLQMILVVLYIGLNHIAAVNDIPYLQGLALGLLVTAILWQGLVQGNKFIWLSFIAACAVLAGFAVSGLSKFIAYVPPVVIPLTIAIVFIHSLTGNNVPLVTDIGEKSRGPLSDEMRAYTRSVTKCWAIVLVAVALWSLILSWTPWVMLWSIVTNFVNYLLIGVMFIGEFLYRQYRFPKHDHPNLINYLKIVVNAMRSRKHG